MTVGNQELGRSPSGRATAAEPKVSALRDGIPSAWHCIQCGSEAYELHVDPRLVRCADCNRYHAAPARADEMLAPSCRTCLLPSPYGDPCIDCLRRELMRQSIAKRDAERGRPLTAAEKLANLEAAMDEEEREHRLLVDIADAAHELIYGGGLKSTLNGLMVREADDKSDPHYRLCDLLGEYQPASAMSAGTAETLAAQGQSPASAVPKADAQGSSND